MFFFFNDTATTEIYTLSLHDALPIFKGRVPLEAGRHQHRRELRKGGLRALLQHHPWILGLRYGAQGRRCGRDRKSTRLNSSHANISYAVFCLKKKKHTYELHSTHTQT